VNYHVRAYDVPGGCAVCIDLPRPGVRLELHGRTLVLLSHRGARVTTVDTRTMRVAVIRTRD
jgi:hypothetical protein